MTENILESIKTYYRKNGIDPTSFNCKHHKACRSTSKTFSTTKAPFIGSCYQKGKIPQLLFISLDPGSSEKDGKKKTISAVRKEAEGKTVSELHKNKHWYQTHEIAWMLLNRHYKDVYGRKMPMDGVTPYFAHTNSAKCSMNLPGRKQGDRRLFKNCRWFIPGEVEVLRPNIIVTQGNEALESIDGAFQVIKEYCNRLNNSKGWSYRIIKLSYGEVLWFHTSHPNDYGRFNKQKKKCFNYYGRVAFRLFQKK